VPKSTPQPKVDTPAQKAAQPRTVGPTGATGGMLSPAASFDRVKELPVTPAQVLQLQRWAGNQAVARLLHPSSAQPGQRAPLLQTKLVVGAADDRYEREADQIARSVLQPAPRRKQDEEATPAADANPPTIHRVQRQAQVGRAGGEVGGELESRLRRSQGGGSALPEKVRRAIEPKVGADLSGVKVHTGSEAVQLNHDLGAKAFTHGNHIYYGAGASPGDLKLTAHEAVHTVQQGAVRRTQKAGEEVQRSTQPGLIQRKGLMSWIKGKLGKKKGSGEAPKNEESTPKTTTTVDEGLAPTVASTVAPTTDSAQGPDVDLQDSVEFERRLGLYGFNHPKATAATKAVVDKMTQVMIGDLKEDDDAQQKQIVALYGKDSIDSAGQVGANFDAVMGVLKEGNLRERMTALYNAMFGEFKTYLGTAIKKGRWAELEGKGMNVTKLKRRKRQMMFTPGASDLYRNPYLKYDRKNSKSRVDFGSNMRKEVKGLSERTTDELGDAGLSDREKAFQFPDKIGGDLKNEKLKWREGATNWKINDSNPWVKNAKQSLKMPIVAGPSGTMTRMLQLWEWLNKPAEGVDWRLAVLAWMLNANDHTFHEMMLAATDYNMPYRAGREAYMDIAPLSIWDLRQNVAKNGLFPHELAFQRDFGAGKMDVIMDEDAIDDAGDELDGLEAKDVGALSPPAAAVIQLYTSFGYLILNPILRGGPQAEAMIIKAIQEKSELSHFKDSYEKGTLDIKALIEQGRRIVPMLVSSLEMLPDWAGHLYRGTASDSRFAFMGKSFKFDKIGSATDDIDVAKDFANDFNDGKYKYILEMDVTAGKDLREISSTANESEVVLPPGSAFTITKRQSPTKDDPYYHIFMTQTGRGGAKLNLGVRPTVAKDEDDESSLSEDVDEDEVLLYAYDNMDDSEDPAKVYTQADKDSFDHYADVDDTWVDIIEYKTGDRYYAKDEEYQAYRNPVAKSKPVASVQVKKSVKLYVTPFEDALNFSHSDASEITGHIPYALQPGWSQVTLQDEDGPVTYFANTDELNDFLGIDDTDTSTQSEPESKEELGLDPADYPAGDYPVTVNGFLKLPASTTPDGAYTSSVELFPNETITAHVEDDLTEDYGRCRIVFFKQTYYVPLQMLVPAVEGPTEDLVETEVETEEIVPQNNVKLPFDPAVAQVYFEYEEWDMLEQQVGISTSVFKSLTTEQVAKLAEIYGMKPEAAQLIIDNID
jgi:hypothetical protein